MQMGPPRITLLLAVAVLAGCTSFSGIAPGTPAERVQARVGAPGMVWKNPDGSELWEYALGPNGFETYMVTIGSDHAVQEVHQVLTDEYFSKVRFGMDRDQVRRLLGKPGEVMMNPSRDEETWTWRYQDLHVHNMLFNAVFDHTVGKVKRTYGFEELVPG
jgi:hypothetical protein